MMSWLWLERSGLALESGRARLWATGKGNNGQESEGRGIERGLVANKGKVCDSKPGGIPSYNLMI